MYRRLAAAPDFPDRYMPRLCVYDDENDVLVFGG